MSEPQKSEIQGERKYTLVCFLSCARAVQFPSTWLKLIRVHSFTRGGARVLLTPVNLTEVYAFMRIGEATAEIPQFETNNALLTRKGETEKMTLQDQRSQCTPYAQVLHTGN